MNQSVPDIRPNYYEANYDASKIAPFTLEDPLTFLNGEKVTDTASWEKDGRKYSVFSLRKCTVPNRPLPEN